MQNSGWPSVFDGHNDMLLRLAEHDSDDAIRRFFEGRGAGHLDWPRMHQGRFGGGLFAAGLGMFRLGVRLGPPAQQPRKRRQAKAAACSVASWAAASWASAPS